jgi:hypothetical protein
MLSAKGKQTPGTASRNSIKADFDIIGAIMSRVILSAGGGWPTLSLDFGFSRAV